MAVVINNQQPEQINSGNNFLLGLVFVITIAVLAMFFIIYLLPRIGGSLGRMQINIPDKFNVSIQHYSVRKE